MENTIMSDTPYVMQMIKPHAQGASLRALRNVQTGIYNISKLDYDVNYTFPMPNIDGFSGSYVTNVDGGSNANGDYEGVIVSSKVNISGFSWAGLETATGRELLSVFVGGENLTFFARYFDIALGEFVIRQFCRGDIEYEINNIVTKKNGSVITLEIDYWKSITIPVKEV